MRGYRILERRYKTKEGEIDIIAKRGDLMAVVEVKARGQKDDALVAVPKRSWRRIEAASGEYLSELGYLSPNMAIRFDLIAVSPPIDITHLPNAWQAVG